MLVLLQGPRCFFFFSPSEMVIHECVQKVIGHLLNLYSTPTPPALPPLRPSESLTTSLFLAVLDGGLARCAGEAGPVGLSWCSLSCAVRWTPGHPILIRFAAAAICPSSMINPGCYLAPTGRAVNTVCVRLHVCAYVCVSHMVPPDTFLQRSVETSKMLTP